MQQLLQELAPDPRSMKVDGVFASGCAPTAKGHHSPKGEVLPELVCAWYAPLQIPTCLHHGREECPAYSHARGVRHRLMRQPTYARSDAACLLLLAAAACCFALCCFCLCCCSLLVAAGAAAAAARMRRWYAHTHLGETSETERLFSGANHPWSAPWYAPDEK